MERDDRFMRDGADLRAELNITLAEALTGFTRDVQLLNGSTISVNRTGVRDKSSQAQTFVVFQPTDTVGISTGQRQKQRELQMMGCCLLERKGSSVPRIHRHSANTRSSLV